MTLPRMTTKRCLIAVAVIAVGIALLRPIVGEYCRRQAYYCGAAANSAMMDVAGFDSEARSALKGGDRRSFLSLNQQLAVARTQEAYYENRRRKYEKVASLLGMSVEDYLPPGVRIPVPTYDRSQRQNSVRP
jgi:hypothetical protein